LTVPEMQGTEICFRCRQVPFNTDNWSLDPRDSKFTAKYRFPLCPGSV